MNFSRLLGGLLFSWGLTIGVANATLIDFESLSDGTSVDNAHSGVTFFSVLVYGVLVFLAFSCQEAFATPMNVSINTSSLSGQSGTLVFDLIDSSSASSSLTINNFTGDVTPGSPSLTGDTSGSVGAGFSLADSSFFNEVSIPVQFGNTVGFTLDFSFGTPGALDFPDELSVFLLTSDMSASLFSTGDPSGADSILTYYVDANGTPNLSTYDASDGSVTITAARAVTTVPEPSPFALMIIPLSSLFMARRRERKPVCSEE